MVPVPITTILSIWKISLNSKLVYKTRHDKRQERFSVVFSVSCCQTLLALHSLLASMSP
jgi:hypothetical protein